MNFTFLESNKIDYVYAGTTGGTSTVNTSSVDMAEAGGFAEVTFLVEFGTAAANNTIKVQQSSDNGSADDWTDLAGSSVAVASSDEKVVANVVKPTKRYLRAAIVRGTSTTVVNGIAIRSMANKLPVVNALAGTIAVETNVSPAEGTA
jgi:hypothetical protein